MGWSVSCIVPLLIWIGGVALKWLSGKDVAPLDTCPQDVAKTASATPNHKRPTSYFS